MGAADNPKGEVIAEQALVWFVRLHSGDCTEDDHRACHRWLTLDEAHAHEYGRIATLWKDLDGLAHEKWPELRDVPAIPPRTGYEGGRPSVRRLVRSALRISMAVAATIALAVLGAWWKQDIPVETTHYRTMKGEQQVVMLPDGSMIHLNTDTALAVEGSRRRRSIVLYRGEALFTVTHDNNRPFEVLAGPGIVRDIGTQFAVYRQPGKITVTVLDGAVQLAVNREQGTFDQTDALTLTQGNRLSYSPDGRLSRTEPIEVASAASWRLGKLVLDQMPLAEALLEVTRYRPGRIRLVEPSLGVLKVGGVFERRNLDAFFHALEQVLPVTVTFHEDEIVIDRADRS